MTRLIVFMLSLFIAVPLYANEVDVHVTWDPDVRLIENGDPISNWEDLNLCIGNEFVDDRTWLGSVYSVAFYDRMLRGDEIKRNLDAGYDGDDRTNLDLIAYYNFKENSGNVVNDQTDNPLNLIIEPTNAVTWIASGGISINGSARIHSNGVASKIINAVKASNQITIEVWIKPANLTQAGPARIVSISQDSSSRNITLGQTAENYIVRCRRESTTIQGTPSLDTVGGVTTELTHVVYAIDERGAASIYINGVAAASQHTFKTGTEEEPISTAWQRLKFFSSDQTGVYDYDSPIATLPQSYDANGYSKPKTITLKVDYENFVTSTKYFVVKSYADGKDEDGNDVEFSSEDSDEVSLKFDMTRPPAVTDLAFTINDKQQFAWTWSNTQSDRISRWNLQRSTTQGSQYSTIKNVTENKTWVGIDDMFVIDGVEYDTVYLVVVSITKHSIYSRWSNEIVLNKEDYINIPTVLSPPFNIKID